MYSGQLLHRLRQVIQYVALGLFLYLFLETRLNGAPFLPTETFFHLDPLAGLSIVAGRRVIVGLLWSLIIVALTLGLGRVWCGWLCPMGTVLDWAVFRRAPGERVAVPSHWRRVKYVLLLVILVAALLGNQTLMIFDPLTVLTRTLATAIWPAFNVAFTTAEFALYPVGLLRPLIEWLEATLRGSILPVIQPYYRFSLIALFFGVIVALNGVAHRFWCRYLCPLGALLGFFSRVAWLRRVVGPKCTRCNRCARECPTGTIEAGRDFASDPAECTVCLDCQVICPVSAIAFRGQKGLASGREYPSRRQVLFALAASAAGVSLLRAASVVRREDSYLLRPPGGRENLVEKCIRCGACLKVCPTSGLQPSFLEGGWEALWTPVLVPRLGYCDYSCHACGQVCPTGAIPNLDLATKRAAVIGKAYIDRDRCLPWADNRSCLVCEEMCPVPDKAIKLDEVTVTDAQGQPIALKRPHVERERCIGCGICEYQCPLAGEAAIRVYVPTVLEA